MILEVKVVPGSGRVAVTASPQGLKVHLSSPAEGGRANTQLCQVLARHFQVKPYQVKLIRGQRSRQKLIQIDDQPYPRSKF